MNTKRSSVHKSSEHSPRLLKEVEKRTLNSLLEMRKSNKRQSSFEVAKPVGILHFKYGWSAQDIQRKTRYSQAQVYNLIAISQWPKIMERYIEEKKISPTEALELSRKQRPKTFMNSVNEFIKLKQQGKKVSASIARKQESYKSISAKQEQIPMAKNKEKEVNENLLTQVKRLLKRNVRKGSEVTDAMVGQYINKLAHRMSAN